MQSKLELQQDAWEGWTGDQSVSEFLRIGREKGYATPEAAVAAYVAEIREFPHGMGVSGDEIPDDLEELLVGYIRQYMERNAR